MMNVTANLLRKEITSLIFSSFLLVYLVGLLLSFFDVVKPPASLPPGLVSSAAHTVPVNIM